MNRHQAGQALDVTPQPLRKLIDAGVLPTAVNDGRHVLIDETDVDNLQWDLLDSDHPPAVVVSMAAKDLDDPDSLGWHVNLSEVEKREAARRTWRISGDLRNMPLVVTVSGFVVAVYLIVDQKDEGNGGKSFELETIPADKNPASQFINKRIPLRRGSFVYLI